MKKTNSLKEAAKTIIQVLLFFPMFILTTTMVVVATACFAVADFQERKRSKKNESY